jgi:hypothetical protein
VIKPGGLRALPASGPAANESGRVHLGEWNDQPNGFAWIRAFALGVADLTQRQQCKSCATDQNYAAMQDLFPHSGLPHCKQATLVVGRLFYPPPASTKANPLQRLC